MDLKIGKTPSLNTFEFKIQIEFNHRVFFTENVFHAENQTLLDLIRPDSTQQSVKTIVFLDQGLDEASPRLRPQINSFFQANLDLNLVCPPILIPGGEDSKIRPEVFKEILSLLHQYKLCRHSYVVVIGGGAVLDSVCFAASIVHRGIRQIRLPSTVLAQTDAGIGIKNGIDYFEKKNFLGTFQPPFAVVNDASLLESLDQNQWRAGTAEAIKVALIRDEKFFTWIERATPLLVKRDLKQMKELIYRGAHHHLHHIATAGDPFEKGSARPLDFGHWSAHKLEQLTDFKIGHGNAVAIGIALDCLYANQIGVLNPTDTYRVVSLLRELGFHLWNPALGHTNPKTGLPILLDGLSEFQEHLGGTLTIPLLKKIGAVTEIHSVETLPLIQALNYLETTRSNTAL